MSPERYAVHREWVEAGTNGGWADPGGKREAGESFDAPPDEVGYPLVAERPFPASE